MPVGDQSKDTENQKRQAEHTEEGHEEQGVPHKEAERRASGHGQEAAARRPARTRARRESEDG